MGVLRKGVEKVSWDPLQQPGECPCGENPGHVGFRALHCWVGMLLLVC